MTEYLRHTYDWDRSDLFLVYDELPLWSAMFGVVLLKYVKLRPNMKVLDVGCGSGFPLLELAQRLGHSCLVCGIDLWNTALIHIMRKADILGIRNVRVVNGDGATMPFGDCRFDLITSNLGINNFRDPEIVLAECSRVAKPGARVVLTTNLRGHMEEFYGVFEATLRELDRHRALDSLRTHIDHRTTVESLRGMLEKVGLRVSNLNRLSADKGELALTVPMAYVEGEKIG